jgi:hypothetical protein
MATRRLSVTAMFKNVSIAAAFVRFGHDRKQ